MKKYTNIINKTEDYIEDNLDKKIMLKDIAKHIGISQYHFHRIFSYNSKETLKHFITRIKMERSAIVLITSSEFSITDIAYKYGYNDSSSYTRAFKKHFSLSPSQFKKEQELSRKDKLYDL